MAPPPTTTGAVVIAQALKQLGVQVIFGIVGVPVVQIAEECLGLGIRFIAFRNEQAASYAATAYGYLTGRPGVCLVVGGPGVLHAMAGVGNSTANAFPLLLMAGSAETHLVTKGAFQELDAITLLAPHTKLAVRPHPDALPRSIADAYRTAWYGRPGVSFVDFPGDIISGAWDGEEALSGAISAPPKSLADPDKIQEVVGLLKSARAPLIVVGKAAAYTRSETVIRELVNQTKIPFLPTPMGKGVVPDSHPSNVSSARSAALRAADVVLVLGAPLNWILHFGEPPKWNENVRIIQVDVSADEIGKNKGDGSLGLVGDITAITRQITTALGCWQYNTNSEFITALATSAKKNEANAARAAKVEKIPMTYGRTFDVIKEVLHRLSPPEEGGIVYVSEGANTMDISRSIFPLEHPRQRLDAGAYATMGVGPGYAIAAHSAYNGPGVAAAARKKIVCFEGDSAFGFSLAEVETMARYEMDILVFVINNSGIYNGDSATADAWHHKQRNSLAGLPTDRLRSTSLGWEVAYHQLADMCGGTGFLVRDPATLARATEEGFRAKVPVVVNVIIEAGEAKSLEFSWQSNNKSKKTARL